MTEETPNIAKLMEQAKKMQEQMQIAQNELSNLEVAGESGGGLVKVILTGRYYARKVVIEDNAINENKEVLQDLIAAAINDATRKVEQASQGKIVDMTKKMGIPTDLNKLKENEDK